jgi:hypothetical protein
VALKLRPQTVEHAFERLAQVAEHMPAVGHLDRKRCALSCPAPIFCRAVTRDDLNARMVLQPGRNRFSCPFRQQIDHSMCVAVHKYGAIHPTTTQREIV